MLKILTFVLAASTVQATPLSPKNEDLPVYTCQQDTSWAPNQCSFKDVTILKENPHFQPNHSDPDLINLINIRETNHIEWFTIDICDYFPNLNVLNIYNIGLEGFDNDAFATCYKLSEVNITGGSFLTLPENLFEYTRYMRTIGFYDTKLSTISSSAFINLRRLFEVQITGSLIEEFPIESIISLEFQSLILYSNNLKDLKVEEILEQFPSLRFIAFSDNDIKCSRVEEMIGALSKREGLTVETTSNSKPREEEVGEVDGIICVP